VSDRKTSPTPSTTPRTAAESSLLEAYVLDFDGDLYGQAIKVRFVEVA